MPLSDRTVIKKVSKIKPLLAVSAGILCPEAFGQEITPTPQPDSQPVATSVEVIVTGSNIPTAEEVGPQPVDTYSRDDIARLGVRSAAKRFAAEWGLDADEFIEHYRKAGYDVR